MDDSSQPMMQHAQHVNWASINGDFELDLTPSLLLHTMANYQLKAVDVVGNYSFNASTFERLVKISPCNNESNIPNSLLEVMRAWPEKLSWPQLNQKFDALLLAWLNDYKYGANLESGLILMQCLELNSPKKNSVYQYIKSKFKTNFKSCQAENTNFQSLIKHLLAKVTNQFEQYKFNYAQNFDLDTGLPNQQMLISLLKQRLQSGTDETAASSRFDSVTKPHFGLIAINLNINFDEESQLHASSSNLMLAAIKTIQTHLHEDATLFHVGPIELVILVDKLALPTQLNLIASTLLNAFETPLPLMNMTLILTPFFGGISTFNTQSNAISLYENARLALHHAIIKNERIRLYDQHISSSFMHTHLLDEAIVEALQQNELEIHLQPIITLNYANGAKETCVSAEVLLRWTSPQWQSVSPVRLVNTIYKKGFGKVFIRWLINNVCRRGAELMTTHQRRLSLTINLGGTDLLDEDLPELLAQSIALWEIPAENLVIEVTESDILIDELKVAKVIDKIVALGCKLALDDFGTGYSSMARLRNMPIDLVKIDQSFVRNIATSEEDRKIVESVVSLAQSLGKEIVAEGVEDIACLNILKALKCEKIQGYFYAKPMPFNEFAIWLNQFESEHQH